MARDRGVRGSLCGKCFRVGLDGAGVGGSWKRRNRTGDVTSQDDGHSNAAIFSMWLFNLHIKLMLGDVKIWARVVRLSVCVVSGLSKVGFRCLG